MLVILSEGKNPHILPFAFAFACPFVCHSAAQRRNLLLPLLLPSLLVCHSRRESAFGLSCQTKHQTLIGHKKDVISTGAQRSGEIRFSTSSRQGSAVVVVNFDKRVAQKDRPLNRLLTSPNKVPT
jgi:hypothetical protein